MEKNTKLSIGNIIKLASIEWRVLCVENNKALLISEKILEKQPYNIDVTVPTTWENSALRKYLNGEFLKKLAPIKSRIADTLNVNPDNPWYGTKGGNDTLDKVFALSLDEVVKYFGDSGALAQKQGDDIKYYHYENGVQEIPKPEPDKWCWFGDQYNNARIATLDGEGPSWWWLRTTGFRSVLTTGVTDDGCVAVRGGLDGGPTGGGSRPALWLNL